MTDSLQEFEEPAFKYKKAGYLRRNIAGLLDAAIVFTVSYVAIFLLVANGHLVLFSKPGYNGIFFLIALLVYRLVCILVLSATAGMQISGTQFMKDDGLPMTIKEKILAACMVYVNGIDIYNRKPES